MTAIRCYCQRAGPDKDAIGDNIDPFDVDVSDIARRPRGLPDDLELDLIREFLTGTGGKDQIAFDTLLASYRQIILAVAQRCQEWYARQYGYPFKHLGDLEADGELGFMHAIQAFNPASCQLFVACAVECIKEAIGFGLLPGRAGYHGKFTD